MALIRINHHPSIKDLRVFSTLWLFVLGGVAAYAWQHGSAFAPFLAVATIVVGCGGLIFPQSVRWIYLGATYLMYPVGFVVSHVVCAVVYFLVLTPYGLIMRLFGHDALKRRFDSKLSTYWIPKTDQRSPTSYFRQH